MTNLFHPFRLSVLQLILVVVSTVPVIAAPMTVHLDARDLPRKLLHATMEMSVAPGPLVFWYPEWIPGIHAPRGPIENMAGLVVETLSGTAIAWSRDPLNPYRFTCEVPDGVDRIRIRLDYITNQPSTNSRGVDSYGNSLLGVINWNTVLMYPDGVDSATLTVEASLQVPELWRAASSLQETALEGGVYQYAPVSLTELMDSPMLLGEHLRSIPLDVGGGAPVTLHLGSESAQALQLKDELIDQYGKMVREAYLLFGGAHYEDYHFLVSCSNDIPYTGLEHLRSSLNGVGERDLHSEDKLKSWVGYLLPHEYVHSWCGKYRRPAGMVRPDFHTAKDTRLLWVYEGLTQYLGHVLTVRSGLWDLEHYRDVLASNLGSYMRQEGRRWRPLEDTAADSYHLRGGSASWGKLRRGQDYYNEGLLFWLEVDALLREKSDEKTSLDDFVADFLGASGPDAEMYGFSEDEILDTLQRLVPHDWTGLVDIWIKNTQDALPLDVVARLGYRIEYSAEPGTYESEREKSGNFASAYHSLGMSVDNGGEVSGNIVPGMPAAVAGIGPGMKVVGVNGKKFSLDRFRDGVKDSTSRRNVELLLLDGEIFKTVTIPYDGGARYLHLVRDENSPDRLADILKARLE